jgi:PEP-CTERM motif
MKLYSKLAALGATLVIASSCALADQFISPMYSSSGTTFYAGYMSTFSVPSTLSSIPGAIQASGVNNSTGTTQVYGISPGTVWAPPANLSFQGVTADSEWISYDSNSGPTGNENGGSKPYDANGFYFYTTNFNTPGGAMPYSGILEVAADDTVAVYLNGVLLMGEGNLGGDGACADGIPNCRPGGFETILINQSMLNTSGIGFNQLVFVVEQSGSYDQGLDFAGIVEQTPEPNTLFLLGTGLLGSAGTLVRRVRASRAS